MINVSNQNNHQDILPNLDIKCETMFKRNVLESILSSPVNRKSPGKTSNWSRTNIHKQGPFLDLKSYLIIQHDHKTIDSLEYCYENFSFPASEIME